MIMVYKKIDYFRVVAAILVVAIHTSPLLSINESADFILTRILARVAVPFFFMASGFFLFGKNTMSTIALKDNKRITRFLSKTLVLYMSVIIIYIPLNIYMGYFKEDLTVAGLLKDFLFNGTLYHLWYLPAAITGGFIAFICINKFGFKKTFLLSAILFVIGIFGDSYYKWIEAFPIGVAFYQFLFQIFDYTRNGIFFAPIFFVMGGVVGKQKVKLDPKSVWMLFIACVSLMIGEGLLLRAFNMQRHDSMYFMLIPTMFFLFQLLLKGETPVDKKELYPTKKMREIALIIYIIHPWVIVGVRMIAKITGTTKLLVNNSIIHFLSVVIISYLLGKVLIWMKEQIKPLNSYNLLQRRD